MAVDAVQLERAYQRYGPSVNAIARRYVNPVTGQRLSGAALLAKLVQGESGGKRGAVSSAGARAWAQFTAGSRAAVIAKYGIDPWRSPGEAVHAAALHLRGHVNGQTGLEGYNPGGGQEYVNYILGQRVGVVRARSVTGRLVGRPTGVGFDPGSPVGGSLSEALAAPRVSQTPLAVPAFAARPVTPVGFQQVDTSGVAAPAAQAPQEAAQGVSLPTVAPVASGVPERPRAARRGHVVVAAGADLPGRGLAPVLQDFLGTVSGLSGRTVRVTTGTNHARYVAGTTRVSEHADGHAADMAVGGDARRSRAALVAGDKLAAHAIQAATGWGYGRALAVARRGGIHNFDTPSGRVQIIWRTMSGGNHFDHVHVGVSGA